MSPALSRSYESLITAMILICLIQLPVYAADTKPLSAKTVVVSAAADTPVPRDLIIVNKRTNKLAYYQNGEFIKEFPVATGRTAALTPEGTFRIVNKIENRPYYKQQIPGGDPSNPLGDRWLGLEVDDTKGTTYAIHGNNDDSSIGKYVSSGCIRMHNDDVRWLFEQVKLLTAVHITTSERSHDQIASSMKYDVVKVLEGRLIVDDEVIDLDPGMLMLQHKTFVPLRQTFELMGGKVHWDGRTGEVIISVNGKTIVHKLMTKSVTVDGDPAELQLESRALMGSTMIPLRDIAELSGYYVQWSHQEQSVRVVTL